MYLHGLPLLAFTALAISTAVPPLGYDRRVLRNLFDKRDNNASTPTCLTDAAPETKAPRVNPWAPLTPDENLAVWNLLHDPASGLNLTDPTTANLTDNYV